MSIKINKESYEKLIQEDIVWLIHNTEQSSEQDHIITVLTQSVDLLYKGNHHETRAIQHGEKDTR